MTLLSLRIINFLMRLYRVNFENNKPVSVTESDVILKSNMDMEFDQGKKTINWITIMADDPQDALTVADEIFSGIIGYL